MIYFFNIPVFALLYLANIFYISIIFSQTILHYIIIISVYIFANYDKNIFDVGVGGIILYIILIYLSLFLLIIRLIIDFVSERCFINERLNKLMQALFTFGFMVLSCIGIIPLAFMSFFEERFASGDCLNNAMENDIGYFTITTFATLGYGDIQPIGICRPVALALSLLGITAVPILVAAVIYSASAIQNLHSGRSS